MRIHSLKMHNFMLFRDFFRIFGDKEVVGIVAEYKDNKLRSNKGGKTTIMEAMRFAFNGSSRAPRNVDLIHKGEKDMWVEVVLTDDDGDGKHRIKRGCDYRGNSFIDADNITKSDEAQKYINELLGFDSADFDLTCFFKQQDINQFMEMKPREKQKHLMQWLNNNHWLKLERNVLDDLSELNKKMVALKSKREVLASQTVDAADIKTQLKVLNFGLQSISEKRHIRLKKLAKLERSVLSAKEREGLQSKFANLKAEVVKKEKEFLQQQEALEELNTVRANIANLKKDIAKVKVDDQADQNLAKAVAAHSTHCDQVRLAKQQLTGLCPILKKACDRIEFDPALVTLWQGQLTKIKADVAKYRGKVAENAVAKRLESQREGLERRVAVLAERTTGRDALKADLARLVAEKNVLEKQLVTGVPEDVAEDLQNLRLKIRQADESIAEFNSDIGGLGEQLKSSVVRKKQLDFTDKRIGKNQSRIDVRKYVAYMFGRNGIPAQEIENGFEEIEDETNYVLQKFGTNMSIMFDPDRELKVWEPACLACETSFPKGAKSKNCLTCGTERQRKRKDELTVKVLEGAEEYDFSMESGGGKTLVSFSNRLALTRLKQRKSGSNFNVLFLDEPDSALDRPNKKAFMDLITTTLIKKFGIEQIFWVSHDRTICESIPNVLKVVRFEKHSVAGWL